ncbi:MAG: C39 family peptidase [Ruminococcus sp.]|nr:C39 family peptidase [Ruminococcus sp.]
MIGKIVKTAAAAVLCTAMVSCGKTVQLAGSNEQKDPDNSSTDIRSLTDEIPIDEETEPVTEEPTDPPRPVAPDKLSVDTDMPSGYELPESFVLDFETVMQEPELPTGCEVTALTETLNYYGFGIDKVDLCDEYLPKDYEGYYYMDEAYVGDPHSYNGFGCYAPVIVNTANDYFESIQSDWYAKDLTGCSLDDLCYQIEQGRPVIVWVTMDMRETYPNFKFTTGNGKDFMFNDYQHCVAIYGFDFGARTIHTADPLVGNIEYDMDQFDKIFQIQGNQAVILLGNEESAGTVYATDEEIQAWFEEKHPSENEEESSSDEDEGYDVEDYYDEVFYEG